jgi:hypothetical protein
MTASNRTSIDDRQSSFLVFVLSLLCPGLGEFYLSEKGRPAVLWFIRLFILIFFPMYIASSRMSASIFFVSAAASVFVLHLFSAVSAARLSRTKWIDPLFYTRSFKSCMLFFIFSSISAVIALLFFLSGMSPYKVKADAYPLVKKGDVLMISSRDANMYEPSDMILTHDGSLVRIITAGESYAEYSGGIFFVDGEKMQQTVPSAEILEQYGILTPEEIYSESRNTVSYLVAHSLKSDTKKIEYRLKAGDYLVVPDDRRSAVPLIITKEKIRGLVERIDILPKGIKYK